MLEFEPATHTYRSGGRVVPGVTTILKPLQDFGRIDPEVLRAKAELGTAVHLACELSDSNDLDETSVHESVKPYLDAWLKFRRETGATVLMSERQVFDPLRWFAGTLDRVMLIGDVKHLLDIKTGVQIPASAGPQTAAYLCALGDATVTRRAVVQLKPDGTYRFKPLNDPNDLAVFMSCLTVHRFLEGHST